MAVSSITDATSIAAGRASTCVTLTDGTARCWGLNNHGQLGDGSTTDRLTPVAVTGIADASAITAGPFHACATLADGTARCWGGNSDGQAGDGTTTDRPIPTPVVLHR